MLRAPIFRSPPWPHPTGADRITRQPALQIIRQFRSCLITIGRVSLETTLADSFEITVHVGGERPSLRRRLLGRLFHDREGVLAREGSLPGKKLKEDRAEAVNIGRGSEVRRRTIGLFRRDVARCSETAERPGEITRSSLRPSESKIANQWLAALIEEDVAGFEVAMEDAVFVRVMDGTRYFQHELDTLAWVLSQRC